MEINKDTPPAMLVISAGRHLRGQDTGDFRARLSSAPGTGGGPVIMDLSVTELMDWIMLGEVAGAFRRCRQAGTGFGIVCGPGPVLDMFRTSGSDLVMDIAPSIGGLACTRAGQPARAGDKHAKDAPGTVTADIGIQLLTADPSCAFQLPATLAYDKADPYAVKLSFHVGLDQPVVWMFARDLLARGLKASMGDAIVQIWPGTGDVLNMRTSSPYGVGRFEFSARKVGWFLAQTYTLVPEGREPGTVMAEIDSLLAPGGLLHGYGSD